MKPLTEEVSGEEGQGLIEYVFVLLFIAVVAAVVLKSLGVNVIGKLQEVVNGFGP